MNRSHILAHAAKDLELAALGLSVSSDGYQARLADKVAAISMMRRPEAMNFINSIPEENSTGMSDEFEELKDLIALVRRIVNTDATKALSRHTSRESED